MYKDKIKTKVTNNELPPLQNSSIEMEEFDGVSSFTSFADSTALEGAKKIVYKKKDALAAAKEKWKGQNTFGKTSPAPYDSRPIEADETENFSREQQLKHEERVHPVAYDTLLTSQEIIKRMEFDHVVKRAPRLDEQTEPGRINEITYGSERLHHTVTEREAIDETKKYLDIAIAHEEGIWFELGSREVGSKDKVKSLRENLTFIGEKEYAEAAIGIGLYWKALLDSNPNQQLLVLADVMKDKERGEVKSDDYLLDNILVHFTNEEVEKYKGRLITEPSKITVTDVHDLRTIFVDDWIISGTQLAFAASHFRREYPQYASSVEIQVIAASEKQVIDGLSSKMSTHFPEHARIDALPVRAYFKAHEASVAGDAQVHITGAHSSVDFEFEDLIEKIASRAKRSKTLTEESRSALMTMPPLTRIMRPYRVGEIQLTQKNRLS